VSAPGQAIPLRQKKEIPHRNVRMLTRAMDSFSGAASRLENYYQHLEQRIDELNRELTMKNRALEAHLHEKEEVKTYLNNILECLHTGIIVIDLNGTITTVNRRAQQLTGVTNSWAQGKNFDDVFGTAVFNSATVTVEGINNDGLRGESEIEVPGAGDEQVFLRIATSSLCDQYGDKVGTIITMEDISELKRLENQAARNNRLAAMGEMAAKMAHEIRNPLGSIELFNSVLRKEFAGDGEKKKITEHISSGVNSINAIISNLLLFVRPHHKTYFQPVDINEALRDSVFFSSHLMQNADGLKIETCGEETPLIVEGDGELLKQVFLNLILNAIQAMKGTGTVTINTSILKKRGSSRRWAVISIADRGIGIPRTDLTRIFDPFFTTKKRGTGLGLSIVHNIVKTHDGTIEIDSTPGKGTICTISIPLAE